MAIATQNDEDLIILGDDDTSDNNLINFNFDSNISSNDTKNDDIGLFWSNNSSDDNSINFLDNIIQTKENNNDEQLISEELNNIPNNKNNQDIPSLNIVEEPKEEKQVSIVNEEVSENKKELIQDEEKQGLNRNNILDEAILKMQTRKWNISKTKSSKQAKVDDLNEQIKMLKKQVSELEKEIKDLEDEDNAIDLDISSIEKMKLNSLEISKKIK